MFVFLIFDIKVVQVFYCLIFSMIASLYLFNFEQVLNEYFHNVCELDLVFNFYKVGYL